MGFKAKCLLFNKDTKEFTEQIITNTKDIIDIIGGGIKGATTQVNVDKYHKVYFNSCDEFIERGVSGWINTKEYYNYDTNTWVTEEGKEYFTGDEILLVLCSDEYPVDITEDAKDFIMSCISI